MGHGTGLSVRDMAEALGVSKSQVARDKQAGMPMTSVDAARAWREASHDVSRTRDGRIDRPAQTPAPTFDAAPVAVLGPRAGEASSASPADDADDDPPPGPSDTPSYRAARTKREEIRRDREQLELDQLRGRLIELDEAKRLAFTAFRTLRDAVLNVPARVKDQVAAESDAFKVELLLEAELTAALERFEPGKVLSESDDDESG